jgi:hypothetical protein
MNLQERILELLKDDVSRTPKEIHRDIVFKKDYFFTSLKPVISIKNTCSKLYRNRDIQCELKNGQSYYYIKAKLETEKSEEVKLEEIKSEEIKSEEEKQKIVEKIIYYEEKRNKRDNEHQRKKNQCRNSTIIGVLSLVVFGFNYLQN